MSTTTIRLPEDLKARIEALAVARGSTSHALMLEAIAETAERLELEQDFAAESERRLQEMERTGEYLTIDDLRTYAMALARGESPARPKPRKMPNEERHRFQASMRRAG